jgi:uncharacterized protein (TIGR00266 family)
MPSDVIDFQIHGSEMQFVEIELDPGEAAIGEPGAMMYMHDGIHMDTVFGDSGEKQQPGGWAKLVGAGKKLLAGENLFTTIYTNKARGKARLAFAAPYPGKIVPVNLEAMGGTFLCQRDAFLCAARGVSLGIAFQKKLGAGFFGGEGFILQKLEGDGMAFIHAGGTVVQMHLEPQQRLRVDTGCLVGLEPSVDYDIQLVGGVKSALFGGEGLFFATLTGPGAVYLQTLPFSRVANRVYAALPRRGGARDESGLGALSGLLGGKND